MSETEVPQEAIIVTTLNEELENRPDQVVIIDPEKDILLRREVTDALHRMANPTEQDAKFNGKQDKDLLVLMRYITEDHPVLKRYQRQYRFDANGDFDINPNHRGGLPEDYSAFQNDQPEYLGPLVAKKGDMCYGQSLFVSTILDQKGIDNGVIQFINNNPDEPDHAVVVIRAENGNIIFDPMYGTIIHQNEHAEAYEALYGDLIPLGYIKEPEQKIVVPLSNANG